MATTKLGGNPVNTNGSLPSTNSPVPAFTLVKDDLSEVTNTELVDEIADEPNYDAALAALK
jgi:peroxiredoxin